MRLSLLLNKNPATAPDRKQLKRIGSGKEKDRGKWGRECSRAPAPKDLILQGALHDWTMSRLLKEIQINSLEVLR